MIRTAAFLSVSLFVVITFASLFPSYSNLSPKENGNTQDDIASVFFADSVTPDSLKRSYQRVAERRGPVRNDRLKILIVPGHDPESYGTQFRGLREHELNLKLGERLYDLLSNEPFFDVYITQTEEGFDPAFLEYFEDNEESTRQFIEEHKAVMNEFLEEGLVEPVVHVVHNAASDDVALRLYAINKWANEEEVDIVIHVHFNDYPGRPRSSPGKYSGFSIYVPESQYSNSKGSKAVAESVFKRLSEFYPQSNFPREAAGIIEDQELIAIGSYNTLDAASLLIEYGYIYEPAFIESELQDETMSDLALQTFLGLLDFFEERRQIGGTFGTHFLPHEWQADLEKGSEGNADVLKLQAALVHEGVYPPAGKSKNDCALTGFFGPCTKEAVAAFQEKYGITPATGFVGELTRAKLNELY